MVRGLSAAPLARQAHVLAAALLALCAAPVGAAEVRPPPTILILESYHRGFPWTDQETDGALSTLHTRWPDLQPYIEALDRKRFGDPAAVEARLGALREKYRRIRLDGVIVTDNAAFEVALAHRADLLGGAPISFAGVNGFDPSWLVGQPRVTGVVESVDVAGTLAMIRALQPGVRNIVVALDRTETSAAIEGPVRAAAAALGPTPSIRIEADLTLPELEGLAARLDPRDALILGSFNRDREGAYHGYEEVATRVSARSRAPVYGLWDFQLGHGIVGGSLLGGAAQGRRAAELLLLLLDGAREVPVDQGAAAFLAVDDAAARAFELDHEGRLGKGPVEVINRPPGLSERHRALLVTALALLAGLTAFSGVLATALRKVRRSERALRVSEERYRSTVDSVEDAIFVHDAVSGDIIDVNRRACEMYGFRREELLRGGLALISSGEAGYTKADAERWVRRATSEGAQRLEWHARRQGGALFWVDVTLRRASIGGLQRVAVVVRDVTDRKAAEKALWESERRFRDTANLLPQVVYETDADLRLVFVNRQTAQTFGYSPEELERRQQLVTLIVAEQREAAGRGFGLALTGAGSGSDEYTALRKDGSTFPVVVFSKPIVKDGRPSGLRGVIVDLTERKRAEEERAGLQRRVGDVQRLESIGRLAGGVAHDFNNLLTPILGHAQEALERLTVDHPVRKDLRAIHDAASRAGALTRQLLTFSRRQVLQARPVDLNAEVTSFHAMLRRVIGEDIEVRLSLSPDLGQMHGDPSQIQQVILNLAVNARDAMPGGGLLTLATRNVRLAAGDPGSRERLELTVTDTGSGMSDEVRAHIFEPFFTTKDPGRGTGLGLATVLGVVQQHGGEIEVRSAPGEGTTFRLLFPRTAAPGAVAAPGTAAAPSEPAGRPGATPGASGPVTVLLAEDEPAVRNLVETFLRRAGHTVLTAADGPSALAAAAAHPGTIDVLLTDVVMSGMNGRVLAEALTERHPGLRVLFMSGYPAHPGSLEELVDGASGAVLNKPFSRDELLQRLAEVMAAPALAPVV